MQDKDFALLAKVLPHMFARWRHAEDFEILAGLPDGEVRIDALTGTAGHALAGPIPLRIAAELKAGLDDQLARKGIAKADLPEAGLTVTVDTSAVKTDRTRIVHFDFRIRSRIRTVDKVFEASQDEEHVWHERGGT
ncbi:MAG: hypothetical protein JWP91_1805 [Fibrobacteres bacterium]|nr:hypothetical protein [Fibrobacterota bacterium]